MRYSNKKIALCFLIYDKINHEQAQHTTELINSKSTEELGQVAPRPLKSGLLSDKIVEVLGIKQPFINECLNQIILK